MVAGLDVEIVRLEAVATQALECFPFVVEALPGFRKCDAAYASRSDELVRLIFDVHDA